MVPFMVPRVSTARFSAPSSDADVVEQKGCAGAPNLKNAFRAVWVVPILPFSIWIFEMAFEM